MDNVIENSVKLPEEWKPIPGYEGKYEISNWGRVKSYKLDSNGKILAPARYRNGYYFVSLSKDGKRKNCTIHRIVATAFIPNPDNLPEVNHKDENKRNNYLGNLEWCDHSYNNSYGTKNQRTAEKLGKPVVQLDKQGNFITEHKSIREASRVTSIAPINICRCCKHKDGYKSRGGFIWIYKDEYTATKTHQDQ